MKRLYKTTLLVAAISAVTACGGGGGGGSTTTPTPTPTPAANFVMTVGQGGSINEGGNATLPLTFSGAEGNVSVTTEVSVDGEVAATVQNTSTSGTISVSVGELINDGNVTITINASDADNRTQTGSAQFALVNTSAAQVIEDYSISATAASSFTDLSTERSLIERLAKLAVMTNDDFGVTEQNNVTISLVNAVDSSAQGELVEQANAAVENIASYQAGDITETQLQAAYDALIAQVGEFVSPVNSVLQETISATNQLVPQIQLSGVRTDFSLGRMSQFIGNPDLGEYDGQAWSFNAEYAYLEAIVFPLTQQCAAQ